MINNNDPKRPFKWSLRRKTFRIYLVDLPIRVINRLNRQITTVGPKMDFQSPFSKFWDP